MCANVDLYSGFVYSMLNIPQDLFTPVRHRMEVWCAMDESIPTPAVSSVPLTRLWHPIIRSFLWTTAKTEKTARRQFCCKTTSVSGQEVVLILLYFERFAQVNRLKVEVKFFRPVGSVIPLRTTKIRFRASPNAFRQ